MTTNCGTRVDEQTLDSYDTVVLFYSRSFNEWEQWHPGWVAYPADISQPIFAEQREALLAWVAKGNKLVIYPTDDLAFGVTTPLD